MTIEVSTPITRERWADRRPLLYLAIAAAALFLLLPQIIGFQRVVQILQSSHPFFVGLAVAAEVSRFLLSAGSTRLLGRLYHRTIPFEPLVETFFVGTAANRTLSTAGAPGMIVRLFFLMRQQLSAGAVAAIFAIEDIIGLIIGGLVLFAGILILSPVQPPSSLVIRVGVSMLLGSLLTLFVLLFVYRHRAFADGLIHGMVQRLDDLIKWISGRSIYSPARVQRSLEEFYAGISESRRAPGLIGAVTLLNLLRYVMGAVALYFSFLALGSDVSFGVLILLYTATSLISTVSAIPGEMVIMGSSVAVLALASGVPRDLAFTATLLSRAIAFWLPIPIGYAALWNLRRRQLL